MNSLKKCGVAGVVAIGSLFLLNIILLPLLLISNAFGINFFHLFQIVLLIPFVAYVYFLYGFLILNKRTKNKTKYASRLNIYFIAITFTCIMIFSFFFVKKYTGFDSFGLLFFFILVYPLTIFIHYLLFWFSEDLAVKNKLLKTIRIMDLSIAMTYLGIIMIFLMSNYVDTFDLIVLIAYFFLVVSGFVMMVSHILKVVLFYTLSKEV